MSMQNAVAAVRGLAGKGQLGAFAVKLRAPVNKFLDAFRPLFHQDARRVGVHNAVAGLDGVLEVQADLIFIAQGDGDPALCVLRV